MKKVIIYLFIITFWGLVGCAKHSEDSLENVNFQILVDETGTENIVIPDPDDKEVNKKVVLPYLETLNDKEELSVVDLSFCGFKNAKIIGYDIGNITSSQTSLIHVQYNFSVDFRDKIKMTEAKEKQVLGNCLALLVSVEVEGDLNDIYVVVEDYLNRKKYISKTIVEDYGDWLPKIYISDVTNDGLDDIIITNYMNLRNTGMVCEILRIHNDLLNSIFKSEEINEEEDTITRRSFFTGRLQDNYKVVIEASAVKYKKSISLLDIGYKAKDLEIDRKQNNSFHENSFSSQMFENKKIAKNVNKTLYISPLDDEEGVQVIKRSNMESVMRLMYLIYMPNRIDFIGKAYAYMNYDSITDSMQMTSAFVDFAESEESP